MQNGLAKVNTQFSEFLDKGHERNVIDTVHAADEFKIVQSREMCLKRTTEREGPGNTHSTQNLPRGRFFGSANHTNQRRFAGAIAAKNAEMFASVELKADVGQDIASSMSSGVNF